MVLNVRIASFSASGFTTNKTAFLHDSINLNTAKAPVFLPDGDKNASLVLRTKPYVSFEFNQLDHKIQFFGTTSSTMSLLIKIFDTNAGPTFVRLHFSRSNGDAALNRISCFSSAFRMVNLAVMHASMLFADLAGAQVKVYLEFASTLALQLLAGTPYQDRFIGVMFLKGKQWPGPVVTGSNT